MRIVTEDSLEAQFASYLGSMLTLYLPPFTKDSEEELLDATVYALQPYLLAMSGHDASVMRRAWQAVVERHGKQSWPSLKDLVDEVSAITGRRQGAVEADGRRTDRQISAHAQRLADDFWRDYQAGEEWKSACSEGWSLDLMRYVGERVQYQAGLLARANGGALNLPEAAALRRHYQLDLMEKAGRVEVIVPGDLLQQWRKVVA